MNRPGKNHRRKLKGKEGWDFVCCRICGDRRQVISARHLSKHEIDRKTYIEEYGLSPDELIARVFRFGQSRRKDYRAYGKKDWRIALKKIYQATGNIFAAQLQKSHPQVYAQGVWIYGDWDRALTAAGFVPRAMRKEYVWDDEAVIEDIKLLREKQVPLFPNYAMQHHRRVFRAALRRFDSWMSALVAARVITWANIPYTSRAAVLKGLMAASRGRLKPRITKELIDGAILYFGSVDKALDGLRKRYETMVDELQRVAVKSRT